MIFVKCEGIGGSVINNIRQARNLAEALNKTVSEIAKVDTKEYGVLLTTLDKRVFHVFQDTDAEVLYYMHEAHYDK